MKPLHDLALFAFADGDRRAAFHAPPTAPEMIYPPDSAGWKGEAGGPSQQAAQAVAPDANRLRLIVIEHLESREAKFGSAYQGETADEIASALGMHIRSIQPRISELKKTGKIEPGKAMGKSAMGSAAHRWLLKRGGSNE